MKAERKILRAALILLLILSAAGCGARPGTEQKETPAAEQGWYREHLSGRDIPAYDAFDEAAGQLFSDRWCLLKADGKRTEEKLHLKEVNAVYQAYLFDHPQMFWLSTSFAYQSDAEEAGEEDPVIRAVRLIPSVSSQGALEEEQELFLKAADAVLEDIDPGLTDRDKAALVHDYLSENVRYEETALYDDSLWEEHSAYGALVKKSAVCDGYALAYQYLLHRLGIRCVCIAGDSNGMAHVWNTAQWDGRWHEIDVTWDALLKETEPGGMREYFDLTSAQMEADHIREEQGVSVTAPAAP